MVRPTVWKGPSASRPSPSGGWGDGAATDPERPGGIGRWRALALYALLTLLLTWPIALRASRRVPDHASDVWIFLWNDWWFQRAWATGESLYRTPYLFHPTGVSLAFHSHSQLTSAIDTLLAQLLGSLAAFNVSILLTFILGGWGMYLLARDITGDRGASFVAGIVYVFAPYHTTQALAHPNLATVQWYPFMALFLRRAMLAGSAGSGALAGGFFALCIWSGLHLGHLGALWCAAFVLFTLVTEPDARSLRSARALAMAAITALLFSLPVLLPVVRELRAVEGGMAAVSVEDWETFQTDPVAWLTPPLYHPVLGRWVAPLYDLFDRNDRWMPYLGFVPLALAVFAALRARRQALFWWGSGLLWMLLAMGTHLRLGGVLYPGIGLPFALIAERFPFSTLRSSDRFNILVPLSLGVLVALGLARLRFPRAALLAGIAIAFEFLCAPIPTRKPPEISPFITSMASDTEPYAVVDVPMGSYFSKRWMYMQTVHGKAIVEGHVSRVPPHAYDFIQSVPLLRAFHEEGAQAPTDVAADLCTLEKSHVRYVLLHAAYVPPAVAVRWAGWFPRAPVHRDEDLIAYTTDGACEAARPRSVTGTRSP